MTELAEIAASVAKALGLTEFKSATDGVYWYGLIEGKTKTLDDSNVFADPWRWRCLEWLLVRGNIVFQQSGQFRVTSSGQNAFVSWTSGMDSQTLTCPAAEFCARAIHAIVTKATPADDTARQQAQEELEALLKCEDDEPIRILPNGDIVRGKLLTMTEPLDTGCQADADIEMLRLKACECIAEGEEGWEELRDICPSTAAVAALRDQLAAAQAEIERLQKENTHIRAALANSKDPCITKP